ncbi:MAG: 50S ribosomal protein L17 [Thermodesulfovibrionales bacterium]|nr:50S ribosomal protein L17 [Thermodesulfovibrionales bacterium]
MRHKSSGRLFGRTANQRKALLKGIVSSLLEYQRIETTLAKAKAAKCIAERIVTMGIKGDLHSKRLVLSYVPNRAVVSKLFSEIAPRFSGRNGGYLRIVQTRNRVNDGAPMAVLEFIDYESIKKPTEEKKTKAEKKTEEKKEEKK